jgi:hypothetical protein
VQVGDCHTKPIVRPPATSTGRRATSLCIYRASRIPGFGIDSRAREHLGRKHDIA